MDPGTTVVGWQFVIAFFAFLIFLGYLIKHGGNEGHADG